MSTSASVHAEQTSAGAGRLGGGWTTLSGAESSSFSARLWCFSPKKSVVDRPGPEEAGVAGHGLLLPRGRGHQLPPPGRGEGNLTKSSPPS